MIVDSHQHFWSLGRGDYDWLTPRLGRLFRDYLPPEFAALLATHGVHATVAVQAAATEAETHYLLELARRNPFIAGVVGWTDFGAADAAGRIAALVAAGAGRLKGLRPMIQDIADPAWVAQQQLDAAFEALVAHGLCFDALVRPVHLEALLCRLERHPRLRAVIDHGGKPAIADPSSTPQWRAGIARLAERTNVHCKLSGLLTEALPGAGRAELDPYVAHLFDCFGPERILWGSDWPVVNLAADYGRWLALARELVERHAPDHLTAIFATNAIRLYGLAVR